MKEGILKSDSNTLIMNGGNPLPGCPGNWDEAKDILAWLNKEKEEGEAQWNFDCGFKLDFDGAIATVSSRFYPPKSHYGSTWDGTVTIYILTEQMIEKKFDCQSLQQLKSEVESYVTKISDDLKNYVVNRFL